MWSLVNQFFNVVFDVMLWPVQGLSATWQICALGLPAAIFALIVFRYTSNQDGIEAAKDKVKGHLLELWLYRDDLWVTLKALGNVLRFNLRYLRYSLAPMAVMIVPFVLMIVQVESRFALRSLQPGESAMLTVEVDGEERVSSLSSTLRVPRGLVQETPALRIDQTGEIVWRLGALQAGTYEIGIQIGSEQLAKRVVVDGGRAKFSPAVYRASDVATLLYPAEAALSNGTSVSAIYLDYPSDRGFFAGLSSATWIFFGVSMILGFALRGPFGVTF